MSLNIPAIKAFLVNGSDGEIDTELSCAKFLTDLETFRVKTGESLALIAATVKSIFDERMGANLNKPAIVTYSLIKMGANLETHAALTEAVTEYIDTNTGKRGASLFGMRKGKGGGFFRHSERKDDDKCYEKENEETAAFNAAVAAKVAADAATATA